MDTFTRKYDPFPIILINKSGYEWIKLHVYTAYFLLYLSISQDMNG